MIRPEAPGDVAAIRRLLLEAFPAAEEADLVERLRADGDVAFALVAEEGGEIAGHVMFSPMRAPFRALGLAPVATAKTHRRRGVAARLIEAGLDRARREGWQGVFVLGNPAYYGRFGFTAKAAAGFACPYAGPHFMALGELPVQTGPIDYAKAFAGMSGTEKMPSHEEDVAHMRRAIAAARENLGRTAPNPVVGCVIVKDGEVLGEACTAEGGRPHAEEQVLARLGEAARGATAYVTLEPCGARSAGGLSCARRLAAAGVARVVIACEDPSPYASGQGAQQLAAAGVTAELGLLAGEAAAALGYKSLEIKP